MNNYYPTINVGDLLIRPKTFGFLKVDHVGVVVAPNRVHHNTPEKGEHLATVSEFSAGMPVKVQPTGANPAVVVARSQKILNNPKQYHPIIRNCERTAYEIIWGIAKSPQFIAAVIAVVVVFLICIAIRRS